MLPNTSRWTPESSCHCSTVAATPDATTRSGEGDADADRDCVGLGRARSRRYGAARCARRCRRRSCAMLTPAETYPTRPEASESVPRAGGGRRRARTRGQPKVLAVELPHLAGERGEHLVRLSAGTSSSRPENSRGPEHQHGERCLGGDLAVRGPWSSSASSPTQSPGPSAAIFWPPRTTSAWPSTMMNASRPTRPE